MAGQEDWMAVATGEEDDIRERILTGYKDGKPFTPYVPTLRLPAPIDRVLDFGCGLGRNFPFLRRAARTVAGFDLPPMIERCRTAASEPIDLLTSDWDCLKVMSFDLKNILDIVAQTGRYDADECVEVDHDPVTHQLRVLGRMPFDEARTGGGDRHYELLLKSRR
jgi:SAM-dependent methyltransferase